METEMKFVIENGEEVTCFGPDVEGFMDSIRDFLLHNDRLTLRTEIRENILNATFGE